MIKPCPRCGSLPDVIIDHDVIDNSITIIYCPECKGNYTVLAGFNKDQLIELWNEKAEEKLTKEQLLENWENGYFK